MELLMATTIKPDQELIKEVIKLGGFKSGKAAVDTALAEYIKLQKRLGLVALAGTIDYDADYDYKKLRTRKSFKR
jgi:Arc/MetJ family transcription regulator